MTGGLFKEKELYIFCKTCKNVVPGRPLLCCPSCKEVRQWSRDCHISSDAELWELEVNYVWLIPCRSQRLSGTELLHSVWKSLLAARMISWDAV